MSGMTVKIESRESPGLGAFLEARLYAYNVATTGIDDGVALNALLRDSTGNIIAGINGHTWGGCCEIKQLWVSDDHRGKGLGRDLMQAAEAEAIRRGCHQIVLATFDFQAPGFYEKLGFERVGSIPGYPREHESLVYRKTLSGTSRA